jgi:hypothetical protein
MNKKNGIVSDPAHCKSTKLVYFFALLLNAATPTSPDPSRSMVAGSGTGAAALGLWTM